MARPEFVYVTYIATTPKKLWNALLDPKVTAKYWQHLNLSDWKRGSKWEHRTADAKRRLRLVGKVLESRPPRRLVMTWAAPGDAAQPKKHSRVTFEIAPHKSRGVVRLTVTHERLEPRSEMLRGIREGWPMVLSSLKSILETRTPLPRLW